MLIGGPTRTATGRLSLAPGRLPATPLTSAPRFLQTKTTERKSMNNKFDELTKSMAQSVTRRAALKKFGVGLVAAIAASLGLRRATAAPRRSGYCQAYLVGDDNALIPTGLCVDPSTCQSGTTSHCSGLGKTRIGWTRDTCSSSPGVILVLADAKCSF